MPRLECGITPVDILDCVSIVDKPGGTPSRVVSEVLSNVGKMHGRGNAHRAEFGGVSNTGVEKDVRCPTDPAERDDFLEG